jgi:protein-disulfide isomerase
MKINKKLSVIGVILVATIIIISFIFVKRSASLVDSSQSWADINQGVAARSYIANKAPVPESGDKIFGDAGAALKIFVYEDYASVYSANLADTMEKIKAETGGRLALIVRPYFQSSPDGKAAALAVSCAGEQEKWKEMRALLFARAKNQQAGNLDFPAYARQIGLNENRFQDCLTNQEKLGTIEQATRAAENYGVQGAPTMFVGDEIILGARPYDDFTDSNGDKIAGLKRIIDERLQ